MARAIEQLSSGITLGHMKLGRHGERRASVAQQIHDGDTAAVEADRNLGLRFLGVDAPEVSFNLPGHGRAVVALSNPASGRSSDPFAASLPPFSPPLDPQLQAHIRAQVGPTTAQNQARLGAAATQVLEDEVRDDLAALGQAEEFRFFLAFAGEVMDRYGSTCGLGGTWDRRRRPRPRLLPEPLQRRPHLGRLAGEVPPVPLPTRTAGGRRPVPSPGGHPMFSIFSDADENPTRPRDMLHVSNIYTYDSLSVA